MKNNKNLKFMLTFLAMMFIFNTYISVDAVEYKPKNEQQSTPESNSSQPKIDDDQLVADNFGPGPG